VTEWCVYLHVIVAALIMCVLESLTLLQIISRKMSVTLTD
jgi:hypothetical protein